MTKRWKRTLRRALIATVAAFGFLAIAVAAGIAWLGSEAGSKWALARAQSSLREAGASLDFESAEFRPFTGFRFRNLKASWGAPPSTPTAHARPADHARPSRRGAFFARLLEARYSISFLKREVVVESFRLESAKLEATLVPSAEAPAPKPKAAPAGDPIEAAADLLRRPPVSFRLDKATVDDFSFDVTAEIPGGKARATLAKAKADFAARLTAGRLDVEGGFDSGQGATIAFERAEAGTSTSASAALAAGARWKVAALEDAGAIAVTVAEARANASVTRIRLTSSGAAGRSEASVEEASFVARAKADARVPGSGPVEGREVVREADADAEFAAKGVSFRATPAAKGAAPAWIRTADARAKFSAGLKAELATTFRFAARGVDAPAFLYKAIAAEAEARATIPRDFTRVSASGDASIEGLRLFGFSLEAKPPSGDGTGERAASANAKYEVLADARLARWIKPAASLAKMGSPKIEGSLKARLPAKAPIEFQASVGTQRASLPASKKPFALEAVAEGTWNGERRKLDATAEARAANAEFGRWRVNARTGLSMDDGALSSEGRTEATQLQAGTKVPLELPKAISATHVFAKKGNAVEARLAVEAPHVRVPKVAEARDSKLTLTFRTPDAAKGDLAEADVEFSQGPIALASPAAKSAPPLNGARFRMHATVRDKSTFVVENMRGSVNDALLAFSGDLRGNLKTKDVLGRLSFGARFPRDFPEIAGQKIQGSIEAPFDLVLRQGKDATLTGEIGIDDLSWSKPPLAVRGISGRVPISEKIVLEDGGVRFASLIQQNPFERVNFERIRPLIQKAQQLSIARIEWLEKSYGPFVGFFSVRQNMLFAHQFDLDLGSGRVYGELFFDAYPRTLRFGALTRLTGLDLGQFLPERFLGRLPSGDKTVSGRTGVVFDLNKASVNGRIDVTSIGGPQLVAMINVLDPKFENDKLNAARSALEYGYPTGVAISLQNGYMDMDIDLKALGLSQRQSLRAIPLSGFISSATADVVEKTKKGPIK